MEFRSFPGIDWEALASAEARYRGLAVQFFILDGGCQYLFIERGSDAWLLAFYNDFFRYQS